MYTYKYNLSFGTSFCVTSTSMAGTVKDMSLIKQVLQFKQLGELNRGISRKLPIDMETVNSYVRTLTANEWKIEGLLAKDDPELERMFHISFKHDAHRMLDRKNIHRNIYEGLLSYFQLVFKYNWITIFSYGVFDFVNIFSTLLVIDNASFFIQLY